MMNLQRDGGDGRDSKLLGQLQALTREALALAAPGGLRRQVEVLEDVIDAFEAHLSDIRSLYESAGGIAAGRRRAGLDGGRPPS